MGEAKAKVILLSSEGCIGEDADLGFEILAALLDTLPERKDRPQAIICWYKEFTHADIYAIWEIGIESTHDPQSWCLMWLERTVSTCIT